MYIYISFTFPDLFGEGCLEGTAVLLLLNDKKLQTVDLLCLIFSHCQKAQEKYQKPRIPNPALNYWKV